MKKLSAVVAVFAFALSLVGLTGCQSGPSVEELIREDITTEFDSVTAEDSDFIEGIVESAGDDFETLGIDPKEFASAFLDGFSYKIDGIDVDEENGTAVAKVTMTCKSMGDILTEFQTVFSEKANEIDLTTATQDDLYKMGGEVMMGSTENAEPKENELELGYSKDDEGAWNIDDDASTELMTAFLS